MKANISRAFSVCQRFQEANYPFSYLYVCLMHQVVLNIILRPKKLRFRKVVYEYGPNDSEPSFNSKSDLKIHGLCHLQVASQNHSKVHP